MPRDREGGRARGREGGGTIEDVIAAGMKGSKGGAGGDGERLAVEIEKAKQASLRLLSVRMRSRCELRTRLAVRHFSPEALEGALNDLERVGLVDDRKFARLFLESRLSRRPRSYRILRQELRSKGIDRELIDAAVGEMQEEVTESELARRALGPRLKHMSGMSPDEARARAARYLAGKGFSRSLIDDVLRDS